MRSFTLLSALRRPAPKLTGLILLAAAFLLIGSGRLLGQHACPHHDGGPGAEGAAHGPGHADATDLAARDVAPADAARTAADERADELADGSSAQHHDDGVPSPCTCIGTCHGAAATPLLPSGALLSGAHHEFHRVPAAPTPVLGAFRLLSWLLPPASGPPSRA